MKTLVLTLLTLSLAACHQENSITGNYGSASLRGKVVMAGISSASGPVGVIVSVRGTGMTQVLDHDGAFEFIGVPEDSTLTFSGPEGSFAEFEVDSSSRGPMVIELNGDRASGGRTRPVVSRHDQYEGLVKSMAGNTLTLEDRRFGDILILLTSDTKIYRGNTVVGTDTLTAGTRVHVKGLTIDGKIVATLVTVQGGEDDDDDDSDGTATANGNVASVSGSAIVVSTHDGRQVTVKVGAAALIRQQGREIALSDIDPGDRIQARGTRVDDNTIEAVSINIEPGANNGGGNDDGDKGNGNGNGNGNTNGRKPPKP